METIWTPALTKKLIELWAQGISTAKIGAQLGITKNSVISKAHRLVLTPRPSPLKSPPRRKIIGAPVYEKPVCAWPIGHPGTPEFKFCGEPRGPRDPQRPYCAAHWDKSRQRGTAKVIRP